MRRKLPWMIILIVCIVMMPISMAQEPRIIFTDAEIEFIKNHPVITIGVDPGFVPFEYIDVNGDYVGITAEYLNLISERVGIKMQVAKDLGWSEVYDLAVEGEIDMLPAVSKTTEREQHFLFTDPYYFFQRVIVVKDTEKSINGLNDLEGLTVAVQLNSSHHSDLLELSNINLSLYQTTEGALAAVARGDEIAYVGNMATTNYMIRSSGITGLKFVNYKAEERMSLHMAVRKDWPELVSILNKALATITEEQKIAANSKWIGLDTSVDYWPIIRGILMAGLVVVFIFLISGYWIIKLRREIEKRKRVETDLILAKNEAEVANQIKSSFLARMSHEIRTPLNAITGMAYLMKKTDITTTQQMYIEKITGASSNMLSIINDILDFSKIEAGKIDIEHVPFSLDQVFQEVINIVSHKVEEQGIGLSFVKDPRIPEYFIGDPMRTKQILINVINNAVKFTNDGEVHLDARMIANEGNIYYVSLTVKDTGIGMSSDQVAHLFEPFTQADPTINRRFGGTGLGLSIVKSLVDLLSGEIQVFSKPGEGSTFVITLPLELDDQKESEYKKKKSSISFKGIRTVVLEKTGSNMNLIDSYLSAFGMDCELTTSTEHAVKLIETSSEMYVKPVDLLIFDYNTPDEGGLEFARKLHNNRAIAKMPKTIMTIPLMKENIFDVLDEYGIDGGVGKPIIPSVLYNVILELFKIRAIHPERNNAQVETVRREHDMEKYRLLVVEDNKTNQFIAKSILESEGFEVSFADNGEIGVKKYCESSGDIDLILMDLHMPVMNGYEAALIISEMDGDVPIIAMTADAITGVEEKCKAHGIYHYISKPFDPDELISLIRSILSTVPKSDKVDPILIRSEGLKYLGQNEVLYEMVLKEYYNENKDVVVALDSALDEGDYEEAKQIVHKVKGTSGTIGAKSLHQVSVKLQEAIEERNMSEVDQLHAEFKILMTRLMAEIG
ncbi:MAG: transporter substrate-binding domain-containing protein [Bacillota bacterium]|nr:transporter substrate-binding domain-containing protein [Bacillota bacterium]